MKSQLLHNDIEICSTHNEGKLFVVERFIRTLKNNIYKYITSISKNVNVEKPAGFDTLTFAKKIDLASLESEIDKLDISKLKTTPVDFKKSSDVRRQRSCQ